MATYTWLGNKGTLDPNDASQAINWSPAGVPGVSGDIEIIGIGATLDLLSAGVTTGVTIQAAGTDTFNFTDRNFVSSSFTLGSGTTLNLTGSGIATSGFDINNFATKQTNIHQSGTAATLTINSIGTTNSSAFLWQDSPGGTLNLNVVQNGTIAGDFYSNGPIFELGGTLNITSDNSGTGLVGNRFSNAGYILIAGAHAAASAKITARMDGVNGEIEVGGGANAAALEIATGMGGGQYIGFGGTGGTVKIDATTTLAAYANVGSIATTVLQNSFERFVLFGPGDTIDLAGINPTGLTYSYGSDATFGPNVLDLSQGGSVIARLRMANSGAYVTGTGTYNAGGSTYTSNFVLAADGSGGTNITVSATPVTVGTTAIGGTIAVFNGPTTSAGVVWQTTSNWAAGVLPGAYQAVDFTNSLAQLSSFAKYVLTTGTTPISVGGIALDDHFLHLTVTSALTAQALAGQTGGGIIQTAGTLDIASGGTVVATNLLQAVGDAQLIIEANGALHLGGVAPFALGAGLLGLGIEHNATITTANVTVGGAITIGTGSSANVIAQTGASVSATYTDLGAGNANDPNNSTGTTQSSLTITGANTVWKDAGGDATTPYSGAMLVGGGAAGSDALGTVGVGNGGEGSVTVDQGATLLDAGYAILGVRGGAFGSVTVLNNSIWRINTGTLTQALPSNVIIGSTTVFAKVPALLQVGLLGSGSLNILTGAVVTLGAEPSGSNEYAMGIGFGGQTLSLRPSGSVTVSAGHLDSSHGAISIGQRGDGSLAIINGGTVLAAAGGTGTADVPFAVVVGSRNYLLNGTTTASTGTLTIGGATGTALLSASADFVNGRDGVGNTSISAGGSLRVTGNLWEGGYTGSGAATGVGSKFLVQGGTASIGAGATLYNNSTLDLESGAIEIGSIGLATAGNISIAAGAAINVSTGQYGNKTTIIRDFAAVGALVNAGVVTASAGTLEIDASITGAGTEQAISGGYLKLDRTVASGNMVNFGSTGSTGTVELVNAGGFAGTVNNFWGTGVASGNVLIVDNVGSLATLTWMQTDAVHGTLNVSGSLGVANIVISGTHANGFAMSSDPGVNGVLIYANNTVPCFLRGTMIATPAGEVAVQDLQVGDLVSTHDGGVRPIVWLGFGRSLVTPRNRCDVAPVIVRAGALADNEPCRDLHVTRHHAVLVGAALVPVEHLINGVSVLWNDTARVIEYYHIELDAHAVLRADGAPAESFREDGNAQQFQNTADRPRRPAEPPCLPVLEAGPLLEQAWRTVAARAGLLVPRVDSINADLHLLVDNRRIDGTLSRDGHWSFLLPAGFRSIAIASRTVIPSIDGANPDRRRLGVAVREITLWRNNAGRGVPLNHPSLTDGWHAPSGDHRWTKGLAMLPTETADWFGGPSALRLAMVDTDLSYRLAPTIVQKRANR